MIRGPSPDAAAAIARTAPDLIEMALDRLTLAIAGQASVDGVTILRRLRTLVDACVPERPTGAAQLGVLPEILGVAITLQYPLMELERYLVGERCDIGDPERAAVYLSFVRHHLWRLQQLIRHVADATR
jgi:hypothetical protein